MERESSSMESKRRQSSWRWILFIPFPARGQDNISVIDMTLWIMERGSRRLEHLFHVKVAGGRALAPAHCPSTSTKNLECQETGVAVAVQLLSRVQLFATPWTAACQASLSFSIFRSLFKLMSFELVMPSNHLILCHLLLLLPSIFPRVRVFPSESAICIRWPKCQETGMRMGKHTHFLKAENLKCEILKGHLVLWVPNICSQVSSLKSPRSF